jgi:haloalkane dehalogenase
MNTRLTRLLAASAVSLICLSCTTTHADNAQGVSRERDHMRNARYGEIVPVTGGPIHFTGHVYNTLGLNDCPEAQWKALDPAQLRKQYHAWVVLLNGPRYFVMDSSSIANPGAVATFGGIQARHLADVDLSLGMILKGRAKPFTETTVLRTTRYVYKAGRPVYELTSPSGVVYVMQTYSLQVDPGLTEAQLPSLGSRLSLPSGWHYKVVTPKKDLVLATSGKAYVLQDNLENSYQRATPQP